MLRAGKDGWGRTQLPDVFIAGDGAVLAVQQLRNFKAGWPLWQSLAISAKPRRQIVTGTPPHWIGNWKPNWPPGHS